MAATPSGWLVAAGGTAGISIYPLLADGTPSGGAQVIAGAEKPILAANPAGGPLLLWVRSATAGAANATWLGQDGSVGTTVSLLASTLEPEFGSAIYTNQGFLVALRDTNEGASVMRVGLDGSVGVAHPLGETTEYPQVTWADSEARVLYADFSQSSTNQLTTKYVRLDSTGAPLGSPVVVGNTPTYYGRSPIVTVGNDTIGLLPGYTSVTDTATHLDVARIAPDGHLVHSPYAVGMAGTADSLSRYHVALRGPDIITAWLGASSAGTRSPYPPYPGAIGIARVSP